MQNNQFKVLVGVTQLEMDLMISDNYVYKKGCIRYDLSENHAMFTLLRATF